MELKKRKEVKQTESPIEDKLLFWFSKFNLFPKIQYKIGLYRADFAFPEIKLVVECDGKDFHSTDEQIKRDKIRDEYMQNLGWKVLRFIGGEIYHEPWKVCKEIEKQYYPLQPINSSAYLFQEKDNNFVPNCNCERCIKKTNDNYWNNY